MKKAAITALVTIAVAIIGIFAGGEGTNWTFDFSTNTNISDTDTTIDNSQTNIFNEFADNIIEDATLSVICTQDEIPETHVQTCEEWNSEP